MAIPNSILSNLDFLNRNMVKWGLEFEGQEMDEPTARKILILDTAERVFGMPACPTVGQEHPEVCSNLYEAARILSALSEKEVILIAPAKDLIKENGSFLTFLKRRPFVRCIAVLPEHGTYPEILQKAIWERTVLPCLPNASLQEIVRQAAELRTNTTSETGKARSELDSFRISPEELEALFSSE
jgi:hypothetical protein